MARSTLKQIADLNSLTTEELQDRWRDLVGNDPPRYNRDFLVKRLAYRIQELAHGGLPEEARERMHGLLAQAGYDDIGGVPGRDRRQRARPDLPIGGTRLVREWNGQRHEVTVVAGGFEFQGRRYRSLTAVTKVITGSHWNGPAFFGLRPSGNGHNERGSR